jgi:hypothetical protein
MVPLSQSNTNGLSRRVQSSGLFFYLRKRGRELAAIRVMVLLTHFWLERNTSCGQVWSKADARLRGSEL